jgi:hypothetical protein
MQDQPGEKKNVATGTGIALGVATGIPVGMLFDNLALGIAIGVALGVAFGAWEHRRRRETDNTPKPPGGSD